MYLLRRIAVRAIVQRPAREFSSLRPSARVSLLQSAKPTACRSFHQSRIWRAKEDEEVTPAAAETVGETVPIETAEELAEREQRQAEIVAEEGIEVASVEANATPEAAEPSAAQRAATAATETARVVTEAAASVASSAGFSPPSQSARSSAFPPTASASEARPSQILYIGNLFFEVTAAQLETEFQKFGEVTNSRIVTDSRGLSKGFGYVEFGNQEAADRAVRELDQKVFQGRRMAVQYHVKREPRNRGFTGRDTREPNEPSKTLFIGNMSYQMSDRDLNDLFREIRDVLDVRVAIDRRSGQPRGFAHADFIDVPSAARAKEYLEKKVVYGRQLRVDFSKSSSATRES